VHVEILMGSLRVHVHWVRAAVRRVPLERFGSRLDAAVTGAGAQLQCPSGFGNGPDNNGTGTQADASSMWTGYMPPCFLVLSPGCFRGRLRWKLV
jgi:hypothetical protein